MEVIGIHVTANLRRVVSDFVKRGDVERFYLDMLVPRKDLPFPPPYVDMNSFVNAFETVQTPQVVMLWDGAKALFVRTESGDVIATLEVKT